MLPPDPPGSVSVLTSNSGTAHRISRLVTVLDGLLIKSEDSRAEETDNANQNSHFVAVAGATANAGSSAADGDSLLAFLRSQHMFIIGSVDKYYAWLISEHIDSIATLKEAMSDDRYFHEFMKVGCGSSGLVDYKRLAFRRAVEEHREGVKRAETPQGRQYQQTKPKEEGGEDAAGKMITETDDDVLFGRGKKMSNHKGNIKFREFLADPDIQSGYDLSLKKEDFCKITLG